MDIKKAGKTYLAGVVGVDLMWLSLKLILGAWQMLSVALKPWNAGFEVLALSLMSLTLSSGVCSDLICKNVGSAMVYLGLNEIIYAKAS